jgi:hypothetical protein
MATKKYPHAVIYNGVFYPANTEIEVKEKAEEKAPEKTESKKRGAK